MTDNDFLLSVLSDGEWHSRDWIIQESFMQRGCGLTVHSRAADLRRRGLTIEVDVCPGERRASFYRLVVLEEASHVSMAGGVSSSASISAGPPSDSAGREGALASHKDREGHNGDADSRSVTANVDIRPSAPDAPSRLAAPPGALVLFDTPRGAYGD